MPHLPTVPVPFLESNRSRRWLAGLPLLVLAMPGWAESWPHPRLNDTGLQHCEVRGVWQASCSETGQDAAHGRDARPRRSDPADGLAGFAWRKVCGNGQFAGHGRCPADPAPGTSAHDWACVKDVRTGLLWERKTRDGGLRDGAQRFTRVGDGRTGDAAALVAAANQEQWCGAQDWRLPTRAELQSMAVYARYQPDAALDPVYFGDVEGASTWASDNYGSPGWGWTVDFRSGAVVIGSQTDTRAVRLVRGGRVPPAGDRYQAQGDAVLDRHTGLLWQRCALGQAWTGTVCTGTATTLGWRDALAQALGTAGSTGLPWRLPNAKELASLIDPREETPATDPGAFPNPGTRHFWTSTAAVGQPDRAWGVDFDYGHVASYAMTQLHGVRLVRTAP
ncbi:Lcl C-terminal domain-containing protein [Ideonella livida]|uniref:DUF1566 domain-containing protein n=1 Tax=Ideonella livida TaxID=2707176 RepID=A0A7C9TMB6_9BURK|nr:DUF1566 domain-containing protein [Ideonella livida]NDY92843.1 DUF1566 domain-containing protein [Ideonella livida]